MAQIKDITELIKNIGSNVSIPANYEGNTALQPRVQEARMQFPEERIVANPAQNRNNEVSQNTAKNCPRPQGFSSSNSISVTADTKDIKVILNQLIEGKDYGSVAGIPQPMLFRSGAIKIISFFGLRIQESLLDKTVDVEHSYIGYTVKVSLVDANDKTIVETIASANSLEKKFSKAGMGADSMLPSMASKRALIAGAKILIGR